MIDLRPAQRSVEALLTDTGTLERDTAGVGDDVLNEATGQLVRPAGDSATLWTGPVLVTPDTPAPRQLVDGLDATRPEATAYRGLLPLAAPVVRAGDLLTVNVASRDPQLAGRAFRVVGLGQVSTFAVVRIVELELEA